jgi:hypothetical protein
MLVKPVWLVGTNEAAIRSVEQRGLKTPLNYRSRHPGMVNTLKRRLICESNVTSAARIDHGLRLCKLIIAIHFMSRALAGCDPQISVHAAIRRSPSRVTIDRRRRMDARDGVVPSSYKNKLLAIFRKLWFSTRIPPHRRGAYASSRHARRGGGGRDRCA